MSVSIVIPCRDAEATLAPAIRSALDQTAPPGEVIVVDDGSRDDSARIAGAFGEAVTLLRGPGRGAAAARAQGAARARGARLMFLDADDLLTPGTLAALGATLDREGRPAVALCPWDRLERDGEAWLVRPPSAAARRPGQDDLAAWLAGAWSPPCAVLWDRAAYDRAGGWDADSRGDDDGRLMRRAFARGIPAARTPYGLALYRRGPDGASLSARRFAPEGLRSRLRALEDTHHEMDRAGIRGPARAALAEAARQLAEDARGMPLAAEMARACARLAAGGARQRAPGLGGPLARLRDGLADRLARRPDAAAFAPSPPRSQAPPPRPAGGGASGEAPLVSVVIPTYNRPEATLRAALSALGQSHPAIEIIVIDDGSTDDTAARLATLGDPRLRVIGQPNGGVARARNRGLRAARGAYIAFLDSDDAWRPGKISRQVAALEAAPRRVGLCATGVEIRRHPEPPEIRAAPPEGDLFEALLLTNVVHAPTSCLLIRRAVIEAVGGFDPSLPAIEDWEWLQRAARLFHVAAVDAPLVLYDDAEGPGPRRSRRWRANMAARDALWRRNRHALRRLRASHLYLQESARRELREPEGDAANGRRLVLRALGERPAAVSLWPWLGYMLAPRGLRAWLRAADARRHARRAAPPGSAPAATGGAGR